MPDRLRPCKQSGCGALTKAEYCPAHVTDNNAKRQRREFDRQRNALSHRRMYSGVRWKHLRMMRIREFPFCEMADLCVKRSGHPAPSTDVHHILGVAEHPELAFDYENLQAACHECHSAHTARNEGFARKRNEDENEIT